MTADEADNRTTNFFATAFLAILGTSVGHGLLTAPGVGAVAAELAFLAAAIAAVAWYLSGRNRFRRSAVPAVLLAAAAAAKLLRMVAAYGMLVLGGPDFAVALFLIMALVVVAWRLAALGRGGG